MMIKRLQTPSAIACWRRAPKPVNQQPFGAAFPRFQGEDFNQIARRNLNSPQSEAHKLESTEAQAQQLLQGHHNDFNGLVHYLEQNGVAVFTDERNSWVQRYLDSKASSAVFLPSNVFGNQSQQTGDVPLSVGFTFWYQQFLEALKPCEKAGRMAIVISKKADFRSLLHETFHLLSTVNGIRSTGSLAGMNQANSFLQRLQQALALQTEQFLPSRHTDEDIYRTARTSPASQTVIDEKVADFLKSTSPEGLEALRILCKREKEVREFLLKQPETYRLYPTEVSRQRDLYHVWLYGAVLARIGKT